MPNPKGNPTTLVKYTPKWKHQNTRTIRVPIALADRILDYAHKIDSEPLTQVNSSGKNRATDSDYSKALTNAEIFKTLTQVIETLEKVEQTSHTQKFTKSLKAMLQTNAITPLKSLTQVFQEREGIELS